MRYLHLIIVLFLLPLLTYAQSGTITGKVVRADTKAPLAGASVFLSNSSFGTPTAADGSFTLSGLKPGQYSLIVTILGYEDHVETLLVNSVPISLNIELSPKNIQLKEVNVSTLTKAELKMALEQFKIEFIGRDGNANDCKLINPQVLNFSFHQNKNILEAYTDEFLIVENHALGYRIKFLLRNFKSDNFTGTIAYSGDQLFEELPASAAQKKKWIQKRDDAYYGSPMHFYRSLYKDSLQTEGFKIYRLTRELNPKRPPEDVIQRNITKYKRGYQDSLDRWNGLRTLPVYAKQGLSAEQWTMKDIFRKTDHPDLFAITFPDYLYVIYTNKWEEMYFRDIYRAPNMLNYETTVITFVNHNRTTVFDSNGTVIGASPEYEGTWSKLRLAQMLPVDYVPANKPK